MNRTHPDAIADPDPGRGGVVVGDLVERARLARERLMTSDLAGQARAWRLLHVCLAYTLDMGFATNRIYVTHLAREAGMDRSDAGKMMRRFGELGIIDWEPAPRGSRTRVVSRISLPASEDPHGVPDPHVDVPHGVTDPHVVPPGETTWGSSTPPLYKVPLNHGLSGGVIENPCDLEGREDLEGQEAEAGPLAEGFVNTLHGLDRDTLARLAEDSTPAEVEAIRAELASRASQEGPTSARMDTDAWRLRHRRG